MQEAQRAADLINAGEGPEATSAALQAIMSNPAMMAALQGTMAQLEGQSSGYLEELPKVVRRRIRALKAIQAEQVQLQAAYTFETHKLDLAFQASPPSPAAATSQWHSAICLGGVPRAGLSSARSSKWRTFRRSASRHCTSDGPQ